MIGKALNLTHEELNTVPIPESYRSTAGVKSFHVFISDDDFFERRVEHDFFRERVLDQGFVIESIHPYDVADDFDMDKWAVIATKNDKRYTVTASIKELYLEEIKPEPVRPKLTLIKGGQDGN